MGYTFTSMSNMTEDYSNGKKITVLTVKGKQYVKLDDLIEWLKENQSDAEEIETHWLIKTFVKLKNETK